MSLRCLLGRHADPVWDRAADGTRAWRCPRCWRVRPRPVELEGDPLAGHVNTDPRWRMSAREQHEARSRAVRTLRGIRLRRERALRVVGGGKGATS